MGTNGRSEGGRFGGICAWPVRALYLLVVLGPCLALAPSALASPPSLTWSGGSTTSENWSEAENWEAGSAPTTAEKLGKLTFPRLTSAACTAEPPEAECYFSYNDLSGLTAESMQIDDGDEYEIGGEELTVGKAGLSASPSSGSSGAAWDYLELPLHLGASQKWTVAGHGGSPSGENGLLLEGAVSGSSDALTVELSQGAAFRLENETEVGPLAIDGPSATRAGFENGVAALGDGELNVEDGHSVELSHIFFFGDGELGPLSTKDAELDVGAGSEPTGSIEATSVKLDSASKVAFEIAGSEMVASLNYSQLVSEGAIDLGGATIGVEVVPPSEGKPCPALTAGQTYTFVSTSGTLSGSFANALEHGPDVPITFAESCGHVPQYMRIGYSRAAGTETVTGTVEAKPVVSEDPVSVNVSEGSDATFKAAATGASFVQWQVKKGAGSFEEDTTDQGVTGDTLTVENVTGAQGGYEYRAVFSDGAGETPTTAATLTVETPAPTETQAEAIEAAAAAAKKRQEEEAAKDEVLSVIDLKEGSPEARISSTSVMVSDTGTLVVRIECPAGEASCTGTITLRTLRAVIAGAPGREARHRAAVLTLATGSFSVAGGHSKALTLRLSPTARKLLARSHALSARAIVVAHNPAGATHTDQAIVTLHAANSRHGKG
jgi:hypothetical protein